MHNVNQALPKYIREV